MINRDVVNFLHLKRVLGKNASRPGDRFCEHCYADLGILSSKLDPDAAFAFQHDFRTAARKAYVKVDCGRRVARAILRKNALAIGNVQVGDLVCFHHTDGVTGESRWKVHLEFLDLKVRRLFGFSQKVFQYALLQIKYDHAHQRNQWRIYTYIQTGL